VTGIPTIVVTPPQSPSKEGLAAAAAAAASPAFAAALANSLHNLATEADS
jgi:hypothetical protein